MGGISFSNKLKASTLVETLIAMVIIMGAFALGSIIFMTVFSSGKSGQELSADIILSNIVHDSYANNHFIDELIEIDNFQIEKTIERAEKGTAQVMTCTAYDQQGKLIAERKDVVY